MNWQRGLLRAWIVASVVWIGVSIVAAIGPIRNVSAPVVLHDGQQELEFPGNISKPLMKKAELDYLKDRDAKRNATNEVSDEQVGLTTYDAEADKLMGGYEPRSLSGELLRALGIAASLPLALLFLGLSTSWIIAGFKVPRTK